MVAFSGATHSTRALPKRKRYFFFPSEIFLRFTFPHKGEHEPFASNSATKQEEINFCLA